jgi:hypothetical protein
MRTQECTEIHTEKHNYRYTQIHRYTDTCTQIRRHLHRHTHRQCVCVCVRARAHVQGRCDATRLAPERLITRTVAAVTVHMHSATRLVPERLITRTIDLIGHELFNSQAVVYLSFRLLYKRQNKNRDHLQSQNRYLRPINFAHLSLTLPPWPFLLKILHACVGYMQGMLVCTLHPTPYTLTLQPANYN